MVKEYHPNKYIVTYKVMEGDHYAGGWGIRTAIIETLGDAEKFDNIVKVNHCFHVLEIHGELPLDSVHEAISDRKWLREQERKQDRIKRLEKELAQVKKEL